MDIFPYLYLKNVDNFNLSFENGFFISELFAKIYCFDLGSFYGFWSFVDINPYLCVKNVDIFNGS